MLAFPLKDADIVDAVGEVFVGLELLECASSLAGDFLGVGLGALGCGELGEGGFGFGDAEFSAFPVAVFAPRASSDDMAFAVMLDFDEAVSVGEFELGFAGKVCEEGFEGGVREAGDEFEAFVFEGLEVDFAAHAAVKNEHGVFDLKASAKDFDSASQGGGVGAVASQDGDVEWSAVGFGGDGQDDLRSVGTVVAAVPVAREGSGTGAFKIDAVRS